MKTQSLWVSLFVLNLMSHMRKIKLVPHHHGMFNIKQLAAQGDVQAKLIWEILATLRVSFVVHCASQGLWTKISLWLGPGFRSKHNAWAIRETNALYMSSYVDHIKCIVLFGSDSLYKLLKKQGLQLSKWVTKWKILDQHSTSAAQMW